MDEHDVKDDFEYKDILNEDVEKKLKRAEVFKNFVAYMTKHEEHLDATVVTDSNPEEQKRRKKSTSLTYVENTRLMDEEIIKDLNSISKDPSENIRVLDGVLYIKTNKFIKGDKVQVKGRKDEFAATLSAVDDEDIVVKTKENKRIRISLEDMKGGFYVLSRCNKK